MKLLCRLGLHRREPGTKFIRRPDGYPLAGYGTCRKCSKRLDIAYNTAPHPPLREVP